MNQAYWNQGNGLIEGSPDCFFPFLKEKGHCIALVGAGGKTTLMYYLAQQFCRRGYKTAVTTTTHIFRPEQGAMCHTLMECRARWDRQEYAVLGREVDNGKLGAPEKEQLQQLLEQADQLLVEADGAKRMACKVPAAHEPVIPPQADIVIGVVGLDVLGQSIRAACFRPAETAALLGCDVDHRLTPADLVTILQSEKGTRKNVGDRAYYMVLNKCDDAARRQQGEQMLRQLGNQAVMTCFDRACRQ